MLSKYVKLIESQESKSSTRPEQYILTKENNRFAPMMTATLDMFGSTYEGETQSYDVKSVIDKVSEIVESDKNEMIKVTSDQGHVVVITVTVDDPMLEMLVYLKGE